jgi:hypothetical protein
MKKILLWFFIVMFVAFAAVQYNDPDPYIWIPLYLVPAAMSYLKLKGTQEKWGYFALAVVFFAWAANQFPPAWEGVTLDALGMKTINIELGRESMGLVICGGSMAICGILK